MTERTVFQSITQRHPITVQSHANVWEAAWVMTQANCGSVLIVDTSGALQGILTERDLMTRVVAKAADPKVTSVTDVMTRNPQCVPPEMKVAEAVVIMIERGFRHLPIMSPAKKIMGVFSVRDALPREIGNAVSIAEFNEGVNDALG